MTSVDTLISTLKQAGMRMTPQRAAICKLLAESDAHPTASMIYERVRAEYPSLSLMTVYNTLNTLVDLGVVNALGHAGDDNVHYDADTEPHINLACISCHQITDIPSEYVGQLQGEISATSGYKLLGARVLYYGLCPACQSKSRN
jgi:Fur family transcriptional regulator, peroxide stress response regulator